EAEASSRRVVAPAERAHRADRQDQRHDGDPDPATPPPPALEPEEHARDDDQNEEDVHTAGGLLRQLSERPNPVGRLLRAQAEGHRRRGPVRQEEARHRGDVGEQEPAVHSRDYGGAPAAPQESTRPRATDRPAGRTGSRTGRRRTRYPSREWRLPTKGGETANARQGSR